MKDKLIYFLELTGMTWFVPVVRMLAGEAPLKQAQLLVQMIGLPLLAMLIFLMLWHIGAAKVITSLGQVPGPTQVWEQSMVLLDEHRAERERERQFYERQELRNAERLAADPDAEVRIRPFTGRDTFIDQVQTSLKTVFVGFLLASLIAIPIGIVSGLSQNLYSAINPLIQILKPISPLAWLPIVTMVVSALYVTEDPMFSRSFVTSAIVVMLCSLWPTLINTAVGVSSIDRDLINVGRVLRLNYLTTVLKIVIPSSIPMIFTGLRISLGIGWMVLIAAEMLSQNPGLGKFVWDEFQNGSSTSLSRIMVAVLVIGGLGFVLDRIMLTLQKVFSYDKTAIIR
ncbi:ABC transporter permease [Methylophaga lonarensis MPL]|uniref:ABC transporter permease n=1 Tax=Methylophaga lonarensis MPL TaxID=1286106 RepID=M7PPI3_9GAMM|nr:ABC transporter permease [Methylophaga lonarensis]EMR12364.1 ABC transporter permease [Methylophaga lonarensis MPL]